MSQAKSIFWLTLAAIFLAHAMPAAAQEAAAGEKIFKAQCAACHAVVAGKKGIGPSLFDIAGRQAGTVAEFRYTDANKNSGLTWDAGTLDRYLVAPRQVIPGTSMTYAGLRNDGQRADLVAYLATLK